MFRKRTLQLCGLAVVLGSATVAPGQSYPATTPFNQLTGYSGNQPRQGSTLATGSASLNQMALRNAQQAMQQSYAPSMGMSGAGRIGLGLGTSYSGSKPFTGFSQGPTVSPYLNLFRVDQNGFQGFNYSTLVQPQLQQQQVNRQQERQIQQTSGRLQAIAAQAAFNVQGSKESFPTGHQTAFQYLGHYYPQPRQQQKKR
jgi:hypothetical protein